MTVVEDVSVRVPLEVRTVDSVLAAEGLDGAAVDFHRRVFGNERVRRDPGVALPTMMAEALAGLASLRGREDRVRMLVHARTIAIGAHGVDPLPDLRDRFGLRRATTFAVSQQACASGLLAVDVCGRMLAAEGDPEALAIVLCGEKTFSPVTRLMGPAVLAEGVVAVLVGCDPPSGDPVLSYATTTHAEFNDALGTPAEQQEHFSEVAPAALRDVVGRAIADAGLAPDDVALVLPHNVNRVGWQRLSRSMGIPLERIFLENLTEVGHSFCADPFLNYRSAVDRGLLRPGDHYVMTSLGAGVTWAAMALRFRGGAQAPAVASRPLGAPGVVDHQEALR